MKPILPVAMKRKASSKPETGRPSVRTSAAPLATLIIPSVAMKGGIRPTVISSPLTRAAGPAACQPDQDGDRSRNAGAQSAAQQDARERHDRAHTPERSMPAEMMT